MVPVDILRDKTVFFGLSDDQLQQVAQKAAEMPCRKGTVIFGEGEPGDTLFIVETGAVEISKKRDDGKNAKLATLSPGQVFGEVTLVNIEPRSATAVAADDSTVLIVLKNRDIAELFKADRELFIVLLLNITRILSKRLRRADRRILT